jgi:capsule polysaccharide export protein KpsE/RkpR
MTFLIIKIFVYLVLAGAIGFGAGWLFRNLHGQRAEERSQRAMHEAKSKVPQLESLLRGRDDQIKKLKSEIKERREELQSKDQVLGEKERQILEHKRELNRFVQADEAGTSLSMDTDAQDDASDLIAELSREITTLKAQLERTANGTIGANPCPSIGAEVLETEVLALREQSGRLDTELQEACTDLARQRANVTELERERELQNKSLKVLHQQLQLERSDKLGSDKSSPASTDIAANI